MPATRVLVLHTVVQHKQFCEIRGNAVPYLLQLRVEAMRNKSRLDIQLVAIEKRNFKNSANACTLYEPALGSAASMPQLPLSNFPFANNKKMGVATSFPRPFVSIHQS